MTKGQRITLMAEWWPAACKAQGWSPNDRAKRLEILSQILKRPITSANEIDPKDEMTKVKNHLLGLLADNISATKETIPAVNHYDQARRLRHKIRDLVKCLALYHPDATHALAEIIKDKLQHGAHTAVIALTIDDLTAEPKPARPGRQERSDLDQVLWTLSRTLSEKRQASGDTEHEMKMKAGVECTCATYCRRRGNEAHDSAAQPPQPEPEPHEVIENEPF